MNTTATESQGKTGLLLTAEQGTSGDSSEQEGKSLRHWRSLDEKGKAFAACYVEGGYSLLHCCDELALSMFEAKKTLNNPAVRNAITEVQSQLGNLDFLNEKWVKEQLLRIFPKVMGEEDVPFITNTGEQGEGRKFYPDIAMKILEHVAPKKTTPTVSVTINNVGKLSDAQLEEIAAKGNTYDN